MKDEIKEIITEMQLRNGRYIICKNEDISFSDEDYKAHLLLDYITNLQNRTKELEQINEEHKKINGELRKTINEAINYIEQMLEFVISLNIEEEKREYKRFEYLLNILQNGEENE